MATKNKGLGRGIDALLMGGFDDDTTRTAAGGQQLMQLAADKLQPGKFQPRSQFDEGALAELADSIREQGLMQPIIVRPLAGTSRHEIIAGERRWRAAKLAGLTEVPVIVREVDDRAALALALIENIQREDLNPLEEAQGIARLIEEFSLTHEAAAKAVSRSRSAVSNLLRLLQLAKPVQEMMLAQDLDMGHARALLTLPAAKQILAANEIVQKRMNVREAEKLATRMAADTGTHRKSRPVDHDVSALAESLAEALGTSVQITTQRGGKGKLSVSYVSLDQLAEFIKKLRGKA